MRFFNINFKKKNKAGAVAIIGWASGPTAVFNQNRINKKKVNEHEAFLSYASKRILPCEKTIPQLEEYLIQKYKAIPYPLTPSQLNTLKVNVIMNYFDYVIEKPKPLGEKPSKKEILEYFEKDTSLLQARAYPEEQLGLKMKAYKLTKIPEQSGGSVEINQNKLNRNATSCCNNQDDVIVELEIKSEYVNVKNGSLEIANDLLLFKGVSKNDIKEKSNRFIAYAYALKFFNKI